MRQESNPIYPFDEATDLLLRTDTSPKHIYILSTSIEETKGIISLAKMLNYQTASTAWANVIELLKRSD